MAGTTGMVVVRGARPEAGRDRTAPAPARPRVRAEARPGAGMARAVGMVVMGLAMRLGGWGQPGHRPGGDPDCVALPHLTSSCDDRASLPEEVNCRQPVRLDRVGSPP